MKKIILVALLSPSLLAVNAPKPASKEHTKTIMHGIYSDLQELFPLSFREKDFSSPKNQPRILAGLRRLKKQAATLQDHMNQQPVSSSIAEMLRSDIEDAEGWYARGGYHQASFTLRHMVNNCVSCHSKNPAAETFVNSKGFSAFIKTKDLSHEEKIKLLITTRQFEEAMTFIENYILLDSTDLDQVFGNRTIVDYLKISIQVKNELDRVLNFLRSLEKRNLSSFSAKMVLRWKEDLGGFTENMKKGEVFTLSKIKEKLTKNNEDLFESDNLNLARYVFLASRLQTLLESQETSLAPDANTQAEIYYLLGYIENMVERSFWLSETKFYLQAAIKAAPQSEYAWKAYLLLEELTILGFTGSSGTNIPEDVRAWLKQLRKDTGR